MPNDVKHRLWALAYSSSFVCLPSLVRFLFHRPLMRLFSRVWVGKHSKFSLPQHRSSKNPIAIDCSTGLNFGIVSAPRFGRRFWHGWPRSMNEYKSWCKHAQHEAFVVGARDKDIYCSWSTLLLLTHGMLRVFTCFVTLRLDVHPFLFPLFAGNIMGLIALKIHFSPMMGGRSLAGAVEDGVLHFGAVISAAVLCGLGEPCFERLLVISSASLSLCFPLCVPWGVCSRLKWTILARIFHVLVVWMGG